MRAMSARSSCSPRVMRGGSNPGFRGRTSNRQGPCNGRPRCRVHSRMTGAAPHPSYDPTAFATTDAGSLDVTLAAPTSQVVSIAAATPASRSTVLPRLEARAGTAQLVRADRPRYQQQSLLGEGGVGEVVKTLDNDIDRVVAIK